MACMILQDGNFLRQNLFWDEYMYILEWGTDVQEIGKMQKAICIFLNNMK